MEEWKELKINNVFEISNLGRLRRKLVFRRPYFYYKGDSDERGYKRFVVFFSSDFIPTYRKSGLITKKLLSHRLVAEHFIPNPNNYPIINHIDGNPSNNHVSNLEWCTHGQNLKHAYKMERMSKKGDKNSIAVFSNDDILSIRKLKEEGYSQNNIADRYSVSQSHISLIVNRKIWSHI